MAITVGESIDIPFEVYDTDGDLADPPTLRAIMRAPDGTQTEYPYPGAEFAHPATGQFVFSTPPFDQSKDWWVAFESVGAGVTKVAEHKYTVCGLHVSLVSA